MTMRMPRLSRFVLFSFAAIYLLLCSICPVSSRIYRTNDAVVIEVDDAARASNLAISSQSNRHLTRSPFGMAINPSTGLYYQPNVISWLYPYLYNKPASSVSVQGGHTSQRVTSPVFKQNIACGDGPTLPPQRTIPSDPSPDRIVGGLEAVPNSWPFIVGLRNQDFTNVLCGGSLISPTRILTAAHCVNTLSANDISKMTVSLGMHTQGNLPDTVNDAQQTRRVTRVVYHDQYFNNGYDVAVLTIDPPVIYSKAISPVCLPPFSDVADQFAGKDAAIMGWGLVKFGGTQPNALLQTTVKIISTSSCNALPTYNGLLNIIHICAAATNKDTCQGDSGGPMVVQSSPGSSWTQVGVTSFGQQCSGDPNRSSVYANVAFLRNWIDRYMGDN